MADQNKINNIKNLKEFYKILSPNIVSLSKQQIKGFYLTKNILFDAIATNIELITKIKKKEIGGEDLDTPFKNIKEFRQGVNKLEPFPGTLPPVLYQKIDDNNNNNIIFQVLDPSITPQLRYVEDVDFFMNGIPTSIMSQCVPYFDIVFEFDDYLVTAKDKSVKRRINNELNFFKSADEAYGEKFKRFGMEYFTTPQSLNTDILLNDLDKKNINLYYNIPKDNYRPFIVLESFTIDSINPAGFFSFKNATATIKITDKTKIKNFIQFFKGENYSKTSVYVTYGWVCPQSGNNAYADFINSKMIRRELYGVGNSSFSFDGDGAVSINLNLFSKFSKELQNIPIGMDGVDLIRSQILQDLSAKISESVGNLSETQRSALFGIESITTENKGDNLLAKKLINAAEGGQSYIDINFDSIGSVINDINDLILRSGSSNQDGIKKLKRYLVGYLITILAETEADINSLLEEVENMPDKDLEGKLSTMLTKLYSGLTTYNKNISEIIYEINNYDANKITEIEQPDTISSLLTSRLASKLSKLFHDLSVNAQNDNDDFYYMYLPVLLKSIEKDEKRQKSVAKIREQSSIIQTGGFGVGTTGDQSFSVESGNIKSRFNESESQRAATVFDLDKQFKNELQAFSLETGISVSAMLSIFYHESGIRMEAMYPDPEISSATGIFQLLFKPYKNLWNTDIMKQLMRQNYGYTGNEKDYDIKAKEIYRYGMTFTQHFQSYKKYIQGIIPTLNKWKGQRNNNILRNDVIAVVTNTGFGLAGGYKDGNEDRVVYTLHEEVYRKIKGSLEGFYKNGKKTQVYINKKNKETGETQQIPVTINLNGTTYNIYEGQQKNYYGVRGSDSNKDGNMTISEISNIYLKHQPSFVIYDVAPYLGRI